MRAWSGLVLAGALCAGLAFGATVAMAADPNGATPGFAEITAPDDNNAVAIVTRPDLPNYAIEDVPDRAAPKSLRRPHQVLTALPDGPPLSVEIRFDPHRAGNAERAAVIATSLQRAGISVAAIAPSALVAGDGVGFVFAEDAAAASALARQLPGPLAHATPARLGAHGLTDPAPGTIEIMLGGDRSTS